MSVAQTWLTREIRKPRSKQGNVGRSGAGLLVSGWGGLLGCDGRDLHRPHQPLHAFAVDVVAFGPERLRQLATPVERPFEMQLADALHQRELLAARRIGLVVQARAAHAQQLALPVHRQVIIGLGHRPAFLQRDRPSPRDRESRSTVSSPIFCSSSDSRRLASDEPPGSPSNTRFALLNSSRRHS